MATYDQIPEAGNIDSSNALRVTFATNDCSDVPQLTAWDDETMLTTAKELINGSGGISYYCAVATESATPGADWVASCTQTPGGALKNRLKGDSSFVNLDESPSAVPTAGDVRRFNMALEVPSTATAQSDSVAIAIKYFYTGSEPDVTLAYNDNTEASPNWVALNMLYKDDPGPASFPTKFIPTGPNTVGSPGYLDPVTKPGTGTHVAEEYWVQTA